MSKPKLEVVAPAIIVHPHPETSIRDLVRAAITLGLEFHIRLAAKKPLKKLRAAQGRGRRK